MKSLDFCQHCGKPKDPDVTYESHCIEWDYNWFFCEECARKKVILIEESRVKILKEFVGENAIE